jgi:hypothetical protein
VILDAYSAVTGVPTDFPGYPKGWRAMQLPDSEIASYFLSAFGRPERKTTCSCERTDDSTMTQALHISNGKTLNDKLRAAGGAIDTLMEASLPDEAMLTRIYRMALAHDPSDAEKKQALALLAADGAGGAEATQEQREKIEDLMWAVLTSKEFLFNH